MDSGKGNKFYQLKELQDKLLVHTRSLESLGVKGDTYGVVLTPLVLSKLPTDVRLEWSKEGEGKEGNLAYLLEFLDKEVRRRERAEAFFIDGKSKNVKIPEHKAKDRPPSSASSLHVNVNKKGGKGSLSCGYCHKPHKTQNCIALLKMKRGFRH